jgi:hypothetical protein
MATTTTKEYTVQELSKYGFKANNVYVNFSKQLPESDKGKIVPGLVFRAEVYVADSSKEYVNKILGEVAQTGPVEVPPVVVAKVAKLPSVAKPKVEEVSKGLSSEAWEAKDRRISRQGLIQASLIALAPIVSLETLFVEAQKLAEQALVFVNSK